MYVADANHLYGRGLRFHVKSLVDVTVMDTVSIQCLKVPLVWGRAGKRELALGI